MTSTERASLRAAANGLDAIYQIGKEGVEDNLIKGVGEALKARELVKLRVLESCELTAREAAERLSEVLAAESVQIIGRVLVLYKRNKKIDRYGIK